jgi:4-hydroxy-3-methylbut-2-enyl diphosphate reductase
MKIEIDPAAGFCGGVRRAIRRAEEAADKHKDKLFSLGELVHNEREVERLRDLGIEVTGCERLRALQGSTVIVRAHGEPPETYELAERSGVDIIDATCPVVLKLQNKIRETAGMVDEAGGSIVIYGKTDHPEVKGLTGYSNGKAVVVSSPEEAARHEFEQPVYLFSQTTMSREGLNEVADVIREKTGRGNLFVTDSICGQVYGRAPHLRAFAASFDMVVFVSGSKSSNGRYLFSVCEEANPRSYFVTDPRDIDKKWIQGCSSVGISGAASTPVAELEKAAARIKSFS